MLVSRPLSGLARTLLWDFDRGSWPYDLLCLLLFAFLLAMPLSWLGDPMAALR